MNNNQEPKNNINNIMSENKGRGLFYGVIAIATFIVMAVGATFAYFTATTESMNSAVTTGSTTLQLEYISYGSAWMRNDLIPADTLVVEYSVENQSDVTTSSGTDEEGQYIANGNNTICKDDYGNSICSLYVFQVKNSAASPQTVTLNVVSEINGFASLNAMAYELSIPEDSERYDSTENGNGTNDVAFRTSAEEVGEGLINVTDGNGITIYNYTPIYVNRNGVTKTLLEYVESKDEVSQTVVKKPAIDRPLVAINELNQNEEATKRTAKIADDIEIKGGETKTFAIVLYIKNEAYDQTDTDAAKTFQGQVIVSSGEGDTGVSGMIGMATTDNLQSNQNKTEEPEAGEDEGTEEPTE